jgi:hypothetical protein
MLDPGYKVRALLLGEGAPLRHVGAVEAASDGVEQILVSGQGSGWSGAAFKNAQLEIAGFGINPWKAFPVSIAELAMADDAVPPIVALGILCMAGDVSDVGFHAYARFQVILCELRPGRQREG